MGDTSRSGVAQETKLREPVRSWAYSGMLSVHALGIFHIEFASDPDGDSPVDGRRLQRQDVVSARRRSTSRQGHGVRHGPALVQVPQLALAIFFVFRVKKYAAVKQRAVHVADHGADVTQR
jgi:hypothetical protein